MAAGVRQGVGPADTSQQSQIGGAQQSSDLKGTMPGRTSGNAGVGAPGVAKQPPTSKPPAPPTSLAAGPEASTPSGEQRVPVVGLCLFPDACDGSMLAAHEVNPGCVSSVECLSSIAITLGRSNIGALWEHLAV